MRPRILRASALALLAFAGLAVVGCGGDSGTQPTTLNRTLVLSSAVAYSPSAAPVGTVDDSERGVATRAAQPVIPLAVLTTENGQTAVLWGTRDADGKVTSVREVGYQDTDVTLYARYAANGGLLSVTAAGSSTSDELNSQTGSYVKFGELEEGGNSLVGDGVSIKNGAEDDSARIRATLSGIGVTIQEIDGDRSAKSPKTLPDAWKPLARDVIPGTDPLAGLEGVYQDSETRTKIVTALTLAAGAVVNDPFDDYIKRVTGFLFLDQLSKSYTKYTAKGLSAGIAGDETTPLPYRDDLP